MKQLFFFFLKIPKYLSFLFLVLQCSIAIFFLFEINIVLDIKYFGIQMLLLPILPSVHGQMQLLPDGILSE